MGWLPLAERGAIKPEGRAVSAVRPVCFSEGGDDAFHHPVYGGSGSGYGSILTFV